jgi:hypothetical protein
MTGRFVPMETLLNVQEEPRRKVTEGNGVTCPRIRCSKMPLLDSRFAICSLTLGMLST